jgi:hypothetical protein
MTLQAQVGDLRRPMRPLTAYLESEDAHSIALDAAPVDWTVAATQIDCGITDKAMDEGYPLVLNAASKNIVLPPGQWEVVFYPTITEANSVATTFRIALTNAVGSTVYAESGDMSIAADATVQAMLMAYIHVTGNGGQQLALRAAGGTADLDIAQNSQLAVVRKIGNRNETGQ